MTAAERRDIREVVGDMFGHLAEKDSDPAVRRVLQYPWPDTMSKRTALRMGVSYTPEFHAVACREWSRCSKRWKREEGY